MAYPTDAPRTSFSFRNVLFVTMLTASGIGAGATLGCSGGTTDPPGDGDGDGDGDFLFCSPAETCPPSVEGIDLTTPVSFRTDVYEGYFQTSCGGGSGCHGRASNAAADLYFGSAETPLTEAELDSLLTTLLGKKSELAPSESLVVPGDWQNSWLMTKLDGCQDAYGVECPFSGDKDDANFAEPLLLSACGSSCGDGMPASEGDSSNPNPFPTSPEDRAKVHKVRAWIAQGAQDN